MAIDWKTALLKTAEAYIERGWAVFALRPASKIPATKHGYKDATTDLSVFKEQINAVKGNANIGIATGSISHILVVDIDAKNGGLETYEVMKKKGLPETATVKSGGGGYHLYFKYVSGVRNITNLYQGVDIKADGGSIVAPPSIHPETKKPYEWEDFDVILADPPEWLLQDIEARKNAANTIIPTTLIETTEIGKKILEQEIKQLMDAQEGERNNTLYKVAWTIYSHVKAFEINKDDADRELFNTAIFKGLTRDEVRATLNSAWQRSIPASNDLSQKMRLKLTTDKMKEWLERRWDFSMNEVTDEIIVFLKDKNKTVPLNDYLEAKINNLARDELAYRGLSRVRDTILEIAYDNSFHPIQDYLLSLPDKPTGAIKELAKYFEDPYRVFYPFFLDWVYGAVQKTFTGKQNMMLILDGRQGLGKSQFVRWLVPPHLSKYFIESPINPSIKDTLTLAATKWIWEVAELQATTRKADREALKSFITFETISVRLPYAHYPIQKKALANFVGTVNGDIPFLNDPTGYRRFRVVPLRMINWDYAKKISIDDLWQDAMYLYRHKEYDGLSPQQQIIAEKIAQRYETICSIEPYFRLYFTITHRDSDMVEARQIIDTIANAGYRGTTREISNELLFWLKRKGCKYIQKRIGGKLTNVYIGVAEGRVDFTDEDDILAALENPPF